MEDDVVRWVLTIPPLLGLGLVMGFSPTLYGYSLHQLTRGNASAVRWMVAGLFAASTLLVVIFQFFDPTNITHLLRHRIDEFLLARGVDAIAGILLIGAGVATLVVDRDDRTRAPKPHKQVSKAQGWGAAAVGFGNTLIGFSGIATMYIVGRVASGVSTHLPIRALAYLVFSTALVGPYLVAPWLWRRHPTLAARVTSGYDWVVSRDLRTPLAIAMLGAAAVFLVLAVVGRPGI